MALANEYFLKLPGSYLFSNVTKRVNTSEITHPKRGITQLGIGDMTRPLPSACIETMYKAVEEMMSTETFRGYGPGQGHDFLIEVIIKNDCTPRGIHLSPTEVFTNDDAKSGTGNVEDILRHDNSVGVTDPIYPVYIDSNVMYGHARVLGTENDKWSNVTYIPCTAENHFIPAIPEKHIDIAYLCYPNNPTGITLTKAELKKWVDYTLVNDTLILFNAAYKACIREPDIPHSIYEIKEVKKCTTEFRSFSKAVGFTEIHCEYTAVPKEPTATIFEGEHIPLNRVWNCRQCTKFNRTPYVARHVAEAVYNLEEKEQIQETINYYTTNARITKEGLESTGLKVYKGVNAPYLWVKTPSGTSSQRSSDQISYEANVVGTPGVGFDPSGEGYIYLTAFGKQDDCIKAMRRIKN